jgi:hypothetical protein
MKSRYPPAKPGRFTAVVRPGFRIRRILRRHDRWAPAFAGATLVRVRVVDCARNTKAPEGAFVMATVRWWGSLRSPPPYTMLP